MKKAEFIKTLKDKLRGYPEEVVNNAVSYYVELIDDAVEDGQIEEQVIASLGAIDDIVNTILKEVPLRRLVIDKMKPKRRLETWEIVLIILAFPIWLPLLISLFGIIIGLFAGFGGLIVGLWAGEIGILMSGLAITIGYPIMNVVSGPVADLSVYIGSGIFVLGLGLFLIVPMCYLTSLIFKLVKAIVTGIKRLLVRKGE